jgi:hypothetical protein
MTDITLGFIIVSFRNMIKGDIVLVVDKGAIGHRRLGEMSTDAVNGKCYEPKPFEREDGEPLNITAAENGE